MADGSKLVRVWDASVYPSHALYLDGNREGKNLFREGIEWVEQGPLQEHTAFLDFGLEGNTPGKTPFDQFGSWKYKLDWNKGSRDHPVMTASVQGNNLTLETMRSNFDSPLFPESLAPI